MAPGPAPLILLPEGDMVPEDRQFVPPAHGGIKQVSQAFLNQLADFTQWRVHPKAAKTQMANPNPDPHPDSN